MTVRIGSNLEKAIAYASVLSEKDLCNIYKLTLRKYNSVCRKKHRGGNDIKRRDTKKEIAAGYIKSIINRLELAKNIQCNGNLLVSPSNEEWMSLKSYVEKSLSELFNRPFVV